MRTGIPIAATLAFLIFATESAFAQQDKKEAPFKWVNPFPKDRYPGLRHGTFHSPSNRVEVGYCIYLPPGYDDAESKDRRYPVVYWLHGGRPGGETRVISLTPHFDGAMRKGKVPPMIYVFPNGGEVSHYDYPKLKSLGETAFIKELIPHIDKTYRTIASREGRAVEGFSQGGRGTARYLFKYPELFCSAAPMGGGHQHEKRISENNGDEGAYQFEPRNNTYDLARKFAAESKHSLRILVVVGDKDMNYQANLDWMAHLRSLKIPFEHRVIEGVPHSNGMVYQKAGLEIMKFHAESFKKAAK
jgi:enterochelin esterase-like enzyme